MRLPDIQKELRELAGTADMPRLAYLADAMSRKRHGRNIPRRKFKAYNQIEKKWVREAFRQRGLTFDEIITEFATRFGHLTNGGRISELLHGKRK